MLQLTPRQRVRDHYPSAKVISINDGEWYVTSGGSEEKAKRLSDYVDSAKAAWISAAERLGRV